MFTGRVFACSDLHGRLDLYKQIKAFLKPEDTVYFLGDACDRGPDPWETVKAIARDPQFIYLMGNHEDMMIKSMKGWYDDGRKDQKAYWLWMNNGGQVTENALTQEEEIEGWMRHISKFPVVETYVNKQGKTIYLSHAGFTPAIPRDPTDLIWDRYHIMSGWPEDCDDVIVVHGHTPTCLMYKYDPCGIVNKEDEDAIWGGRQINDVKGAVWYCYGHKVNIDCGAVWTDKTVLLDLDTYEQHIFSI